MPILRVPFMRKGYAASICGVILCRTSEWIDEYVVNHERIHLRQQLEMLFIPFFIAYAIEWTVRCIRYRSMWKAYRNVSYEKEAYANERDLSYLSKRKCFAQFRS